MGLGGLIRKNKMKTIHFTKTISMLVQIGGENIKKYNQCYAQKYMTPCEFLMDHSLYNPPQ